MRNSSKVKSFFGKNCQLFQEREGDPEPSDSNSKKIKEKKRRRDGKTVRRSKADQQALNRQNGRSDCDVK